MGLIQYSKEPFPMKTRPISLMLAVLIAFSLSGTLGAQAAALKVGIFADADSLPFFVCEEENLFSSSGVNVELVRFQSALERDSAFQAGKVDAVISDLLAALLAAQAGFPIRITSLTDGRYGIALAPSVKASGLPDLAGRTIAISSNTVIHYAVDSFLAQAGMKSNSVELLPVPKMPVRLEMLLSGQVAAAGMPEPFLTTARTRGARILATTDDAGMGAGVLLFMEPVLSSRLDEVRRLYAAYWKAAQRINANPDSYRQMLVKKAGFPEEAASAFTFVLYKKPRLPSQDDLARAQAWLASKGLLKTSLDPKSLLDSRALEGK